MDMSMKPQDDDASRTGTVRLGPISLFTLIAVLCLATLAVLSITTSNASYRLATLQGESITQQYQAESAAQGFLAQVCANGASPEAVSAAAAAMQEASGGAVTVEASAAGSVVSAKFSCSNGRALDTQIEVGDGGSYRIMQWKMTAKVNSAETETLWLGN